MKRIKIFVIDQFLIKCFHLLNSFILMFYKLYLFFFRQVDIAFNVQMNVLHSKNLKFGKRVIIKKGCIIDAGGSSKIEIGDDVVIQERACLLNYNGKGIFIGKGTNINRNCILYGHGGLNIGENCLIAANSTIVTSNHNYKNAKMLIREQGETRKGVAIKNNVWIGVNATILDGVIIGNNSVVGAGSVVKKEVDKNCIVAGVPSKIIGRI